MHTRNRVAAGGGRARRAPFGKRKTAVAWTISAPAAPPAEFKRYAAIDGLRFFAALGVVVYHYAVLSGNSGLESLFSKNYLFVDFFFAISGFVIFHSYGGRLTGISAYCDFLKNRIARVYPLHLATLLVFMLLAATLWRGKSDRAFIDPAAILPNLTMMHAWGATQTAAFNYPSWSISAEWFAYLSFPAVVWLTRLGGAKAAVCAALAIVMGLEAAAHLGWIEPWTTLTYHFGALRALPTFLAGAALACAIEAIPLRIHSFGPAWALFLTAFLEMTLGADDRLIIVLLLACLAAAAIAERDGAKGLLTRKTMAGLGDLSYALYMIHPLMGMALISLLGVRIFHLAGTPLVLWCAFCALVPNLIAAYFIYHRFETPWRRRVRRLALPKPSAAGTAADGP